MFYRLHSLDKSCDGFPTCLILLTDIDSANTVVAHSRLSKVHGKTNACLVESGIYIYIHIYKVKYYSSISYWVLIHQIFSSFQEHLILALNIYVPLIVQALCFIP